MNLSPLCPSLTSSVHTDALLHAWSLLRSLAPSSALRSEAQGNWLVLFSHGRIHSSGPGNEGPRGVVGSTGSASVSTGRAGGGPQPRATGGVGIEPDGRPAREDPGTVFYSLEVLAGATVGVQLHRAFLQAFSCKVRLTWEGRGRYLSRSPAYFFPLSFFCACFSPLEDRRTIEGPAQWLCYALATSYSMVLLPHPLFPFLLPYPGGGVICDNKDQLVCLDSCGRHRWLMTRLTLG